MKLCLCYVCPVVNWPQFESVTRRFVSTYIEFPPHFPHELHVVWNGGEPQAGIKDLFSRQNPVFHEHDNSGWDVGAYRRVAAEVDCDFMLFLNTNSHFRRAGWLTRLVEASQQFGPGLYGASASFEIAPHIRTTAFMCEPKLVRAWTGKIAKPGDRHYFEVGRNSLTALAKRQRLPCVHVTWDGAYLREQWRQPPNIFRRGDQSNCLIFDRHHEIYEASTAEQKSRLGRIADGNKWEYYRRVIPVRLTRWFNGRTNS